MNKRNLLIITAWTLPAISTLSLPTHAQTSFCDESTPLSVTFRTCDSSEGRSFGTINIENICTNSISILEISSSFLNDTFSDLIIAPLEVIGISYEGSVLDGITCNIVGESITINYAIDGEEQQMTTSVS